LPASSDLIDAIQHVIIGGVFVSLCKIVTGLTWAIGICAYFFPMPSGVGSLLRAVPVFLLVAHLLEAAIFWKVLKNASGSPAGHVLNTLIFGLCHVAPIKKAQG
jgi:uncharacterized protein YhhL (DUF1145 family)